MLNNICQLSYHSNIIASDKGIEVLHTSIVKVGWKTFRNRPTKSQSHPRHLAGKAQHKETSTKTSQATTRCYFPYRWSPAGLIFNIYFYLFLYLYITRITINNDTPHRKPPKNQNRRAALGRPAIKLLEALTSLRSTSPRP